MSTRSAAKRAKLAEVPAPEAEVEAPEVEEVEVQVPFDPRAEAERLERCLCVLKVREEAVPRFSLVFPTREWAQPSVRGPAGGAAVAAPFEFHFAALYFYFGPDSVRNMDGVPDRDPVFLDLRGTSEIPDAELTTFLIGAATVADAHSRLRKLGELAGLRALLGDADWLHWMKAAPLGRGKAPVFWHTQFGLQIDYGPTSATRISICAFEADGTRVPLTPDELAAKVAHFAPKAPK